MITIPGINLNLTVLAGTHPPAGCGLRRGRSGHSGGGGRRSETRQARRRAKSPQVRHWWYNSENLLPVCLLIRSLI